MTATKVNGMTLSEQSVLGAHAPRTQENELHQLPRPVPA